MTGFMNAELEAIRSRLQCGHCHAIFTGTDSQARKVKYEQLTVYCSPICRSAATSKKAREQALKDGKTPRKGVLAGPCPTCGNGFESRVDKVFCSMACYMKSDTFRAMRDNYPGHSAELRAEITAKLKKGQDVPCVECGQEFYQKRPAKGRPARKFCGTGCYRSYMAKRFDRWVANPEGMALPQCYDEFLDREELNCVVDGCSWRGQHLSLHMNQSHGVQADDFKRAAGFNLSTGVVGRSLAEVLRDRSVVGVAAGLGDEEKRRAALSSALEAIKSAPIRYRSIEGAEHKKKARAIMGSGPQRTCAGCGCVFHQSTPMGKALYCTIRCRSVAYATRAREKAKVRARQKDGTFRWSVTP